jgi:hypothetical protein
MDNKYHPVGYFNSCSDVGLCSNNSCFFKQRDVYGYFPFAVFKGLGMPDVFGKDDPIEFWPEIDENDPYMKRNAEILEIYGPWKFPNLHLTGGTNIMCIMCDDKTEDRAE